MQNNDILNTNNSNKVAFTWTSYESQGFGRKMEKGIIIRFGRHVSIPGSASTWCQRFRQMEEGVVVALFFNKIRTILLFTVPPPSQSWTLAEHW